MTWGVLCGHADALGRLKMARSVGSWLCFIEGFETNDPTFR